MKTNDQNQRRDNWRKIVDEYLTSNMTQKAFCEQRNISLPKFVYYHGQFKREKCPQGENPNIVPVKITPTDKPTVASEITLSLPNGFRCVFPIHADTAHIKRLVEALLSC